MQHNQHYVVTAFCGGFFMSKLNGRLNNQVHIFHSSAVFCAGRNDINPRRVYTAVTKNISKLGNVFFNTVKSAGK